MNRDPAYSSGEPAGSVPAGFSQFRPRPDGVFARLSLTNAIIAVNVAVFVAMAAFFGAGWFETADLMPYVRFGANNGGVTTDGEWWRLLTSMFLHFGVMHLAFNMVAFFQVGRRFEGMVGSAAFALAYFGSGLCGGLASIGWHGDKVWSAGASGAIFGIYGAFLAFLLRRRQGLPRQIVQPLLKSTLAFCAYNLLFGMVYPGIDNADHVGGFLSGIVIGWVMTRAHSPVGGWERSGVSLISGAIAAAAMIAIGVALVPRFSYRLADELAWNDVNREEAAREVSLIERQQKLLKESNTPEGQRRVVELVRDEIVPFYEGWADRLHAMSLAEGRVTDRRRRAVEKILREKVASYRAFADGVESGQLPAAWRQFESEQKQIANEVAVAGEIK